MATVKPPFTTSGLAFGSGKRTGSGGGGSGKGKGKATLTPLDRFLWAEGEQESGNNYGALNRSSGALGRWQVMPANLPGWLARAHQRPMDGEQFLRDPSAQNAIAITILGGYYYEYGPAGAAAVWYSGQPNPHATYGNPPVYQYVDDVLRLMGRAPISAVGLGGGSIGSGLGGSIGPIGRIPGPGSDDWSPSITLTVQHFVDLSNSQHNHTTTLAGIRRNY